MTFFKSALPVSILLVLAPVYGSAQQDTPAPSEEPTGPDMAQIEEAWAAGDFVTVRRGLRILAQNGNSAFAHYRYGRVLLEGRGGPKDLMAARDWLEKAASANQTEAAVLLARLYLSQADGGPDYDVERAASLFKTAAARGNPEAQYYLGLLHQTGTGVPQNLGDMVTWLTAAAENGHVEAMFELGRALSRGQGAPMDAEDALRWLQEAAVNGHAEAQFFMAYALDTGQGAGLNREAAAEWLLRSAEAGFILAQNSLGRKYLKGDGLAQNSAEGMRWLSAAAQAGDAGAMTDMAEAYLGKFGVAADYPQAARLFAAAVEEGIPRAMVGLAGMYERGDNGTPDLEQAVRLYRLASDAGSADATLNLGRLAGEGRLEGLMAPHRAVPWASVAAAQGDAAALAWIEARAEEGLRPAQTALGKLLLEQGEATAQVADLLQAAAIAGDVEAQHQLGLLHVKGAGVDQDYVTAHKWLNIAAAGGSSEAVKMRDVVADLMTAVQVAEAQRAARTFFELAAPTDGNP